MSPRRPLLALCLLAGLPALLVARPQAALAQEEPDSGQALPAVPAGLAEAEEARSRSCVSVFATLEELEEALQPVYGRGQRINALGQAMRLEDSTEVAPFDLDDPLETTVQAWFESDAALGRAYAESGDSAVLAQRREEREALMEELRDSIRTLNARGQEMVAEAGDVQGATAMCQGKILVRPAVLEVCDTTASPVCEPARAETADGAFRFVDQASDLWDVEQLNPWSEPAPLARGPEGSLIGGRTAGSVRRGNVRLVVGVGHIVRPREQLSPEQAAEFDANLDSLGFTFDHPDLVMAPALDVLLDVPGPLAGETHYLLHFGDLSDPATQVVWTVAAGGLGPIQASMPAAPGALARLQAGEGLSLTAVRVAPGETPEETAEAEALYSLPLTPVSQAPAVAGLLSYMAGGGFAQDLARLVPPSGGG